MGVRFEDRGFSVFPEVNTCPFTPTVEASIGYQSKVSITTHVESGSLKSMISLTSLNVSASKHPAMAIDSSYAVAKAESLEPYSLV